MVKSFFLLLLSFPLIALGQAFKIDQFKESEKFNESNYKVITNIQLIGNKTTKDHIVLREIPFSVGDTVKNKELILLLDQSKKNILNTSLFNFAKLDVAMIDSVNAIVIVQLTERWYIFPLPIFEIDDNNFNTWWRDRDYSRINYGMHLSHNNFRGRKERLSITAKYGFTERYRLRYVIPYLNKKQKSGLSLSFSYNRRDEVTYITLNNERLQYKNFERDALRNYSAGISYTYRKAIYTSHSVGVEYDYHSVVDSVTILNPNYLGDNRKKINFVSLGYTFTNDRRDSKNYPLKGSYTKLSVTKYGLGISSNAVDLTNFNLEAKKFIPLNNRFFLAGSIRGLISGNNNQPYLLRNGLGYSSFGIRSYEYYVIDGQNIGLAKAQLRFQLVKPRSFDFGAISEKFGKFHYAFYLGVFTDAAYVEDNVGFPENNLANELQFGSGIGLDFVSYYDIVVRTEFSINKFGESGIFLHFVAPI